MLQVKQLTLADEKVIQKATGGPLGFSGPCGLKGVELLTDHAVACMEDGITGANKKDKHLVHVVPGRDFSTAKTVDIRYVVEADPCPKCRKPMALKRAIEVGHVFKLGTKYSEAMNARFLDSDGKEKPFIMGCYGIGINRIMASAIEQNNDKDGISWPLSIAPYQITVLSLNTEDKEVSKAAEDIYKQLTGEGLEVLFDDRSISAGIKFKDADLIGTPLQIIVGSKGIGKSVVELKIRPNGQRKQIPLSEVGKEVKISLDNLRSL